MKKINKTLFFLLVSFIGDRVLLAASPEKKIFFCTKDVDVLQLSPSRVVGYNPYNQGTQQSMNVSYPLVNDYHNAFNLRHCFLAFAMVAQEQEGFLSLTEVETRGYGVPFNTPQQGFSKTGASYSEAGLQEKIVSCVPILLDSQIKRQNTEGAHDIYDKWAHVLREMSKEAKSANYNAVGHNCCSVAYHVAVAIGADLSQVNPENFNFKGVGILWGQTLGNITDSLATILNSGIVFMLSSSSSSTFMGQNVVFIPEPIISPQPAVGIVETTTPSPSLSPAVDMVESITSSPSPGSSPRKEYNEHEDL